MPVSLSLHEVKACHKVLTGVRRGMDDGGNEVPSYYPGN